jgi:TatD DNase family protein
MFTDSHCHLDFPELASQLPAVLDRMAQAQVSRALCISVTLEDYPAVLALAMQYPVLFATVGVHPDSIDAAEPSVEFLVEQAANPKVLGIGETGLDYYRLQDNQAARLTQQRRFSTHIQAAVSAQKPLIIHTRSASADTLGILKDQGQGRCTGVFHCFTETVEVAKAALDLGFYISLSGIVTFKNAADLREVAKMVPRDRLLIETDAPYLAPVPYRGKLNEPAYVAATARFLADWLAWPVDQLADQTSKNFDALFIKQ